MCRTQILAIPCGNVAKFALLGGKIPRKMKFTKMATVHRKRCTLQDV